MIKKPILETIISFFSSTTLGPDDYILYTDPEISENPPFWGPILTGLSFFAAENRKCDQIFSNRNSVTDSRKIIKIGMWVRHEKYCT